jgi:prepilin-type N-terminal cleavage/methylation domain-containing protein
MKEDCGGFTMVELLVVVLIGSILTAAVVALFIQQTVTMALNEDLVDLEQNLRAGMNVIYRDVRTAGLFSASEMPPFDVGNLDCNGDGANDCRSDGTAGGPHAVAVRYAEQAGLEITETSPGGPNVNVYFCSDNSLGTGGAPTDTSFFPMSDSTAFADVLVQNNQISYDIGCGAAPSCPSTPSNPTGKCDNITFPVGQSGGFHPAVGGHIWHTMQYNIYSISADHDCDNTDDGDPALIRVSNAGECSVVAFGVNDLRVTYILEDGTETTTEADLDTAAELATIRRVRLQLTGETRNSHTIGGKIGKRERTMTTEVLVRNLAL